MVKAGGAAIDSSRASENLRRRTRYLGWTPPGADSAVAMCVSVLIPTEQKRSRLSPLGQTGQIRSAPTSLLEAVIGWGDDMEHFLLIEMTRDKYVERCKQRAFDHLDRADLRNSVASFVRNMNALPDCELPNYLAMLGGSLLTANDALGRRTLIEGLR